MRPVPEFLYPRARDHAFDEVCEHIVRALEKRHFDVPGIEVEFDVYGRGQQLARMVRRVAGQDFSVRFGRSQGYLPGNVFYDMAAVDTVGIPREQISVYGDHSGPRYYAYVGDDWARDREWFFASSCFVNSKLRGEPRKYLQYTGSDETGRQVRYGYHHSRPKYAGEAKYLVHTNDLGREHDLGPDDAPFLVTTEVTERMTRHLEQVLARIEEVPEREEPFVFVEEPVVPVEGCPEFWAYADASNCHRIRQVQKEPEEFPLAMRHALLQGYRLVGYDHSAEGLGHDPSLLHSGFVWCIMSPDDEMPYEGRSSFRDQSVVRIQPNRANDIYVVDQAAYERRRSEIGAQIETENEGRPTSKKIMNFTNAQVGEMYRARARTLVKWTDYDGSYERPLVIIGREVDLDEVEVVCTCAAS